VGGWGGGGGGGGGVGGGGDATGLSDLSVVREITYEPTTQQLLMYVNALPGPTRSATLLPDTAKHSTA